MAKKKHDRWAGAQSITWDDLDKSGYRFSAPPQAEEAQVPAEPESRGVAGWAKDGGISLLKGAIALPESFVGMADIATGGRVGKALEGVGYEPSRARAILDEYLTDNQKAANAEFQKAEGIPGKFAAAIQNPSVIGQAVIESAPSMLGGAGVARGLLGVAPKMGAVAAGALGEGIVGAGQAAEQIRTQTPDRLLSTDQSMSALASGAGTAVFGALGGKISQRLGIGDVDTMLAQAAVNPVARKGVVRAAIEGFISEGVLEELPQSIQEQVWQNQALGRPLSDGVDEAAVLGLLSGGAMGMVAGPMSSGKAGDPIRDLKTGGTDPLSRAADIGLDAKAKQADAGITEGQYNAAMAAMEGQLSDDQKAIKNQGRADKTGFAGQPAPKAPSMAQAMGLTGDAVQEVSAFADRAMLVKESLADPTTRDFIRQNLGDEAFNEAAYYAEQADRPGDIPDKTRENMLALAEAIISRARLTPITPPAGLGSNVGPALDALGAPQAVPAIGLDTTPTGAFRVDAAGNAAPEVRADVISTRQAQAERDVLGAQARKSSAVPADPAPAQPQAPKALGYDTAPTGVVRVDSQGQARPETRADQINARQSAPARDDTTGQQARKASAVWADPAPKKRETPALGYDVSPTGRMVAGPDGISVETNAERINRQQARSTQPGDITRPGGQPFKNLTAAKTEQRRSGGAVVEVTGGWVVRPQAETINGDTGQTAGRSAGSVGAGSPDAPASPQGAGFSPDVRGRTDSGGSGRADGSGVPERNLGSPVAAQPGATRDARGQLKPPAFLRKTLPEMTEGELTQASEFYGADHPRASKVKQEVEKRERKAKFEAKKNPKPEQANEQDAPQTQSAPTQAQPGQEGSDPAGTGTPGDGAKERVPGTGGADVQADGVKPSRTYDQIVDDEFAAIKQAYADAGREIPLTFEQFMQDVESGKRLGHPVSEVPAKLAEERASLEAVKSGSKSPRSVLGAGATKKNAITWLEGNIERLNRRAATGGASEPTNRGNYNYYLRAILRGEEPAPKKQEAEAKPAEKTKKAPYVSKEDGDRLFGGVTGQVVDKRPKARKHPPTVRGSGALADISRALGGLSPDLLSDLSEKVQRTRVSKAGKKTQYTTWDNPAIPGIGPLFRMGGTADLSEVARVLEESGYLEAGAVENDPVGAKQRAEAIIKAELREGGRTLRVGDADAIESEMRGRQEAAMDEMSDPWDDFSFAPDDLDAAGYTGLSEETRAATEQLIAEAEGLGIDTEAIRDDTARIVGDSASQEEYHAATQEAIRQAIAQVGRNAQQADASGAREGDQGGGSPAEQAGGTRSQGQRDSGSDQEGLSLTAPTRADIEAQQDRAEQADALDEKAQAKRESEVGDSTFMTGFTGDGRQDNTADLFAQAAEPEAKAEPETNYVKLASDAQRLLDGLKNPKSLTGNDLVKLAEGVAATASGAPQSETSLRQNGKALAAISYQARAAAMASPNAMEQGQIANLTTLTTRILASARSASDSVAQATGARRDPTKVSMFNPYEDGDIVTIDGQDWAVKQDTPGWYLTNTGNWRGTHPTIRNIKAMADLIRGVEQASVAQKAAPEPLLTSPTEPEESPPLTEAEARKRLEWRDMGQRDNTKRLQLSFQDADGRPMTYGTLTKDTGAKAWTVADSDGWRHSLLTAAKKKAEDLAIERLRKDGYVTKEQDQQAATGGIAGATAGGSRSAPAVKPTATIEDSGQVLEGARKMYAANYAAKLDEGMGMDVAAVPLSKSWPEPDYRRLLDEGADPWAVAFMHAVRDEIPTKPSKGWKLKGWAQKVEKLRDFAKGVSDGRYTKQEIESGIQKFNLQGWAPRIELYEAVGHDMSLKGVTLEAGEYGIYGGEKFNPPKTIWAVNFPKAGSSWGNDVATGDTKAEAIEKFKAWYAKQGDAPAKEAKLTSFDIYTYRSKPGVIVGKRLSSTKSIDLKTFATVKEAREYKAANQDELERLLAQAKDEPSERRETNAPRVGDDHRNGADVTTEQFRETFGFRGEQFGASMPQGERQANLNMAYDALMDLAGTVGIPPRALSLNGELGLAFGARGRGGKRAFAAHYEADTTGSVTPSRVVINLTRKNGAGSLAHEWFHAVDNYFGRMRGMKAGYLTESYTDRGDGVRPEMVSAFRELMGAINRTGMKERSSKLDAARVKDYWSTGLEMAARSFESYVIAKLQDQNKSNDYLANVVNETLYAMQGAYPYPSMGEMPAIRAAFDNFFQTIQTREDDAGNVGMFSRQPEDESFYRSQVDYEWAPPSVVNRVKQQVESLRAFWKNSPEVVVLASFADAPVEMQKLNDKQVQNGAVGEPEGFFHKGKAYLLAPHMKGPEDVRRVLFHETLGHLGLRGVFGDRFDGILDQLWAARKSDVEERAAAYGLQVINAPGRPTLTPEQLRTNRRKAAEEVLAKMAETRPEIGFVRRSVAIVKQWLRKNLPGFGKMKMSDDEIVANFLMPAQRFIERGKGAQGQQLVPAFSRVDEAGSGFGRNMPATIKVDGKDRPTMNSNGQPIHPTEEGVRNFWSWFADSKAVDGQGRPLVVYHGTVADFQAFDNAKTGANDRGLWGRGHYFASNPTGANSYALRQGDGARVIPAYVSLQSPLVLRTGSDRETRLPDGTNTRELIGENLDGTKIKAIALEGGHDGVIQIKPDGSIGDVVAYKPTQIKSAIGNSGDFNPEDPNIGFSRSAAATDLNTKARNAFSDFVGSAGVQMDWLDKTLNTQYAKAERFPEFKRVFDKLQDYIEGVSSFANQAADKAPDILPKLDSFKDLMREGPESLLRHGLSQEDIKALSAPVFEGTLSWTRDANGELVETQDPASAGVVFTDAELRDKFGMSKKQIGHYRQFRATVDESLDQVVAADIIKLLGKKAPAGLKALANTADGRARLREALRQTFGNSDDADAKAMWDDQIAPKYDHVASMKAKGYAPLSRFGKFFVHVVDKQTGETAYFGMEETRIMSNQRARDMRVDFGPGFDVTQGTMSQESYKLMSDVPVDAMEMFASAIGAEKSEVFQKYIALAKNNRSTLKRLLKRKGRKGFSLDAPRVLASFVTSNARASAAAVNMMDAKELAQGIQAGDVKDEAIKLIEAVSEPQESGAKVRGLMFINFIGGSIASAVVNMTQPVMMTLPYLSQFGGITKAGKRLVSAASMVVSGKVSDPEISEALKRAESEGIVAPQEIHHLLKQATSSAHINPKVDAAIQKLAFVWSTPFALAESFNRKASFIAAYQTAKDEGIANPYAFAQKAVTETQGLYNSGNKPNAARGTLGATVMTFKQYSIHYLEWLARMAKSGPEGKKAALWALALLVMAAGSDGLPFSEDLNDVIDTVGQSFGYDTNTKRWRHQVAADALGEEAAEVLSRGLSASAGFPVDVSMRMGMGNLLPATDMLKKSNTDTARSLAELAGPGGALFTQYSDAIKLMLSGEAGAAAMKMTPNALQNLGKAAKMMETGEYRDSKDRKVMEVDGVDAAMKALSFQPAQIARESAKMSENRQSEMLAKAVEGEITDAWARAMVDGDAQAQEDARQRLLDWNKKNPDMPIRVNRAQIATKAKKMRQSRAERYIKTVAPERRQAATKEVES